MSTLLICPSSRPAVEALALHAPLAAIPLLGESLVEYWLTYLAECGTKEVHILASDRPETIATLTGGGLRWGVRCEVIAESRELTPGEAQIKYPDSSEVIVLDCFPRFPHLPLFTSYTDLFAALFEFMPKARTIDRVGVREASPGIWVGLHTHICPGAQLHAPCWIGQHNYIGPDTVVGPMAIVEDRSFVESGAEIVGSVIGPDTFVGQFAALENSFAIGSTLINWKSGLCTQVPDAFLLCALRRPTVPRPANFLNRLAELYARNKEDLQLFWKHFLMDKEG